MRPQFLPSQSFGHTFGHQQFVGVAVHVQGRDQNPFHPALNECRDMQGEFGLIWLHPESLAKLWDATLAVKQADPKRLQHILPKSRRSTQTRAGPLTDPHPFSSPTSSHFYPVSRCVRDVLVLSWLTGDRGALCAAGHFESPGGATSAGGAAAFAGEDSGRPSTKCDPLQFGVLLRPA